MTTEKQQQPTQFEKFLAFTKKVVSVPKAEIDRREKEYQKRRRAERLSGKGRAAS